ncbi:trimeric LpxA-like protein [Westerdykella ornata]|uniref:Trimeric LpxA-like protein n=1 Tax=Westerdykella ornata TaxID=318751 RepID=A0A6A6JLQ4_WESOR|nr:trimeric LpxA-like protein [Westerdykella ornata]KAF2277043.1 trimeric LpxA-like protein [Westerdykella ornata]
MSMSTNKQKMLAGELYHAFTPELSAARARCRDACMRYNNASESLTRRERVRLFRDVIQDDTPLPPEAATPEEDESLFADEPHVLAPLAMDYGFNVRFGKNVFVNFNSVFLDTCLTTIGSRTLVGPNVSFFSATHPLDPVLRNGLKGPEMGKEIHVGEDCWIGGNGQCGGCGECGYEGCASFYGRGGESR